jgi:hypothetical protein
MYADYERLVLEEYQRKKSNGELPLSLVLPTPARLKSECERVCTERFQKKDEKVIRDFFGKSGDQKVCLQAIQLCKPDKFKPLINFLNGETSKTDEKNIQLLAWLIDLPHRPFDYTKDYTTLIEMQAEVERPGAVVGASVNASTLPEGSQASDSDKKTKITETQVDADRSNETIVVNGMAESNSYTGNLNRGEDADRDKQPYTRLVWSKRRFQKVAMVGLLLAFTGTGGYWWWDAKQPAGIAPGNGGCMYWAKDHFQPIPCTQKVPNTLVVALDTVKVKNFKRITRPDTITNRAKGSVWYSKIDNEIEFFTADGEHPVVIGRRLKPITDYIIDKYIHPGVTSN